MRHLYYIWRSAELLFLCAWVFALPKKNRGQRLQRGLQKLGPSFIKLGQTLSTRPDIIGDALADSLAELRDNMAPFSSKLAKKIVERELGAPISSAFEKFDEHAIAAASIAQVHKAVLLDGKVVAVKLLRPGIARAFARDIGFFYWLAGIMECACKKSRRLKPREVVRTLEQSVQLELDLRFEAASQQEMQQNIIGDPGFRIPAINWHLTTENMLVSEWIEGIPLHEVEALKAAGHDVNALLAKFSENFFKHVFRDGFFHADLHPGNLFVDPASNVVAVDFGIMGRLDIKNRLYMAEIFHGFLNEDYKRVAEAHFRAGYVPANQSVEAFALACMAIAKPILDRPLKEVSAARLLGQLFKVTETFQMETQPQLLLFQKTLVVVEGVGRMLNPEINMWEMARSPIQSWAEENLGPMGRIKYKAEEGLQLLQKLPSVLRNFEEALTRWTDPKGIRLHPDTINALTKNSVAWNKRWMWLALILLAALGFQLLR